MINEVFVDFPILASSTPNLFEKKARFIERNIFQDFSIVFVDVLRSSTTLTVLGASGCLGIHLTEKPSTNTGNYDYTPSIFTNKEWIYGGKEHGQPIPGGVVDNSPISAQSIKIEGKYLKFFSRNGASAFISINTNNPGAVFLMCMANIKSTIDKITSQGFKRIWFIGSGLYGNSALEDSVCCGEAIHYLITSRNFNQYSCDDEAVMMLHSATPYLDNKKLLVQHLLNSQIAKFAIKFGWERDIYASILGDGLPSELWLKMSKTVIQVKYHGTTPLLVPIIMN